MNIGYVFDPSYLLHNTGADHPDSAGRLEAVMTHLNSIGLLDRLIKIEPRRATRDELSLVHTSEYQNQVASLCAGGGGILDADTILSAESCNAAEYAAGGAVAAIEAVMDGVVGKCFALVRPPGHHASADRGSGFCIYNNAAIAVRVARAKFNLTRIAIIDFDVHHGNGTQSIFDDDPDTMYVSTHQSPYYPGSGSVEDIGTGAGSGTKVNIPLPPGCGDAEYIRVYDEIVMPVIRRFNPELMLVSAGYDAHRDDPLAGMKLTTSGYAEIVKRISNVAAECCGGRAVFCLEGGYNLVALARCVAANFNILLGESASAEIAAEPVEYSFGSPDISGLIADLKKVYRLS